MANPLLVNLSPLLEKPTGIANYINNIIPYFNNLDYVSLIAEKYYHSKYYKNPYFISDKLSPDKGSKGHFLRLVWTQFQLPNIYEKLRGKLYFSPVPEMPLFTKIKAVVMVHDLIPLRFPKKNSPLTPYFRYYIPEVCQQAKHIICNSQATADDLVSYLQINSSKITPIHLSYSQEKYRVIENLPKHNYHYFLYLGRHDPHKNLSRIITAFAQFKGNENYQLWLAGSYDSRYTPLLEKEALELGILNQVKFLDYVKDEDLPILLNQALALVFPSLWEGFGFPVLEAMACGTPVITSFSSSLGEVAGDAALLVNPESIEDIRNKMKIIAEDEDLRKQLKQLGLERVKQFSWQKTAEKTIEILNYFQ